MSQNDRFAFLKSLNRKTRSYEGEMSFFDHLEELRWHIIRSLLVVAVIAGVAFSFPEFIFLVRYFGMNFCNENALRGFIIFFNVCGTSVFVIFGPSLRTCAPLF